MDASLDTDVIIHLYQSGRQDFLLTFFDRLYFHEFLLESELKKKSQPVYKQVLIDIDLGRISVVSNKELTAKGIRGLFDSYMRDYEILFDTGETHAIALAKAMGIVAFVSDDTKEHGPHDLLVRELIEDVIPFAFYELLFIQYLCSKISLEELSATFETIIANSMSDRPMNFNSRMNRVLRRFSQQRGTKRDQAWMKKYCIENSIHYDHKIQKLQSIL